MSTVKMVDADVNFDTVTENLQSVFRELFACITMQTWTAWSLEDQQKLNTVMKTLFNPGKKSFLSVFRPAYDQTVWNGHSNGTVDTSVTPIRAPRKDDAEKPGRKANAPTPDEIFASLGQ